MDDTSRHQISLDASSTEKPEGERQDLLLCDGVMAPGRGADPTVTSSSDDNREINSELPPKDEQSSSTEFGELSLNSNDVIEEKATDLDDESVLSSFDTQEARQTSSVNDTKDSISDSSSLDESADSEGSNCFRWIVPGLKLMVQQGRKKFLYSAKAISSPFKQDDEWVVTVRWETSGKETVSCSRCQPIGLETNSRRSTRKLTAMQMKKLKQASTQEDGTEVYDISSDSDEGNEASEDHFGERLRANRKISQSTRESKRPKRSIDLRPKIETPGRDADGGPDHKNAAQDSFSANTEQRTEGKEVKKASLNQKRYQEAKDSLCAVPGVTEAQAEEALKLVGPPYGLQAAMQAIHESREPGHFGSKVGMKIQKVFEGRSYYGQVTNDGEMFTIAGENGEKDKQVRMWEVTYESGLVDDLTWEELVQCRADKPQYLASCRGRPLQCLELFSGCGIVSQEFCERKWKIVSVDSSRHSTATIQKDILKIKPEELPFVPDFIWASPPCHTYSNLAGDKHRVVSTGHLERSPEAIKHNFIFQKMTEFMYWARKKHPHLIVVIENPVGKLMHMPLMKEFASKFGLYKIEVNYCAFGRGDKKPTCIWTNDFGLQANLSQFTCMNKCRYYNSKHPLNVRRDRSRYDSAMIPQPLAEEVAEYVNSKFYFDRVREREVAPPTS